MNDFSTSNKACLDLAEIQSLSTVSGHLFCDGSTMSLPGAMAMNNELDEQSSIY